MAVTLDLALVREQCRVIDEVSDVMLQSYVDAALAHVQMHCDRVLVEGDPADEGEMNFTPDVRQAVLLLVAHWVSVREAVTVGDSAARVPLGFDSLLWYRKRF
ncbi:phage gp6-like head-tail connector protein [Stenotrophomonas maltophilia]|uniref:head-tail connector protein n=1 Tax=Stenotrophomonas maltophilia TaxID=40324 RepID=UPI0015DD6A42|nr:head-tail connector protein [Stenotrophomonas maltophilia]MBA0277513.1 phage gp6-like head-tail connector protein [Stenotrophomonas maltophilia]MBA0412986.1 phage gp6-like head-tail connector protein [Stenotrophomonas maltophilia]MBA0498707.1 phage gp6-like head-tail connector protein [Stenotrophomonas maltophilia]MBA0502798.1 phage gp6-like head-tail connector protein [Stenotrophomonas maltophilia]MBA0507699.1 phage gp6-like head-tail connector protein [Stenotrophomonas maltophilia]